MKLTEEQKEKLFNTLKSKGPSPKCPLCQTSHWSVSDTIFEFREFQGGKQIVGGDQLVYPVIPLNCQGCGHTLLINPILFGIIDGEKKGVENE